MGPSSLGVAVFASKFDVIKQKLANCGSKSTVSGDYFPWVLSIKRESVKWGSSLGWSARIIGIAPDIEVYQDAHSLAKSVAQRNAPS